MADSSLLYDVAVIGAGMAGLTCARKLTQAGQRVVILEKSRGVGGRLATRRLHGTRADHGACYLSPKQDDFQDLLAQLVAAGIVQVWIDQVYELDAAGQLRAPAFNDRSPRYVAAAGMTAIAKFLATDLDVRLSQRVHAIRLTERDCWQLSLESANGASGSTAEDVIAKALVVAVPAPQAVQLLQPLVDQLSGDWIQRLKSVQFLPCLSVMAGYAPDRQQAWDNRYPHLKAVTFSDHAALGWMGLDSSKRTESSQPVFVIQSSAALAESYLEANDLQPAAYELLNQAARSFLPWLATPEWFQVHRWRYAFAQSPLPETYLTAETAAPLVFTGDWCGGRNVEQAFLSGLATAAYLLQQKNL